MVWGYIIKNINESKLYIGLNLLVAFNVLLISGSMIFDSALLKLLLAITTGILVSVLFFVYRNYVSKIEYIVGFFILWLNIYGNYILNDKFFITKGLFWPIMGIAIGLLIVNKSLSIFTIYLPFLILNTFIFITLSLKISTFSNNQFFEINRNSLPMLVFSLGALINILHYYNGSKRPIIIPSLLIFIVSYLSYSRLALLVSALYFILILSNNIFYFYKKNNGNKTHLRISIGISVFIVIIVFSVLVIIFSKSRFKVAGISSSGRIDIYKSFLNELTFRKLFSGFRSIQLNTFSHMHNAYIQLVMSTGLFGIIILIFYSFLEINLLKTNFFIFFISLLVALYSAGEHFMFFQVGDILLMPILICSYTFYKNEKSIKVKKG